MASFLMVFLSLPLNKLLYNGTSVSSSVSVSTSTSNNDEDNKGTILSGWVRSKQLNLEVAVLKGLLISCRSQTTMTRFWLLLTTYPPLLTCSMVYTLTKSGHFWNTQRVMPNICDWAKNHNRLQFKKYISDQSVVLPK